VDITTLAASKKYTDSVALGQGAVQGPPGIPGQNGQNGANGQDGKSAYEIAVDNGFIGTEAQWLVSLEGAPGQNGQNGVDRDNGEGVPEGGTTGQILSKKSDTDYDTEWVDPPTGGGSGGYNPPQGGIPLGDLAQSVQNSLELAETALQEETDPIYSADKANIALKSDLPESLTDLANDGQDPFITESDLDNAIEIEGQARQADIETVNDDISNINEKIPTQASDTNQLADKDFVNSSVANTAAHFVSYDAQGNPFPTNAALLSAATFYYRGAAYTPTEHDYTTVTNDETHSGEQWRYGYDGAQWFAQYKVNPTPFTSAQQGAIDSNITQSLTTKLDALPDNATLQANFATAAQGAKADSALQSTDIDTNPTQSSNKAVSSGGVFAWFGAAVSTLSTTAKTVVGAINELFASKQDKIAAGTAGNIITRSGTAGSVSDIPQNTFNPRIATTLSDGTDLNTITTSGYYKGYGDTSAVTMLNMPPVVTPVSFILIVLGFIDSNQNNMQILRFGNTRILWQRTCSSGGLWGDWHQIVPKEHRETLANNTDLDDVRTQGVYQIVSSGNANTILNRPLTSSPTGFILEVEAQLNSDGISQTVKYFNNQNLVYYRSGAMNSIGWQPWILLSAGSATPLYRHTVRWSRSWSGQYLDIVMEHINSSPTPLNTSSALFAELGHRYKQASGIFNTQLVYNLYMTLDDQGDGSPINYFFVFGLYNGPDGSSSDTGDFTFPDQYITDTIVQISGA